MGPRAERLVERPGPCRHGAPAVDPLERPFAMELHADGMAVDRHRLDRRHRRCGERDRLDGQAFDLGAVPTPMTWRVPPRPAMNGMGIVLSRDLDRRHPDLRRRRKAYLAAERRRQELMAEADAEIGLRFFADPFADGSLSP